MYLRSLRAHSFRPDCTWVLVDSAGITFLDPLVCFLPSVPVSFSAEGFR